MHKINSSGLGSTYQQLPDKKVCQNNQHGFLQFLCWSVMSLKVLSDHSYFEIWNFIKHYCHSPYWLFSACRYVQSIWDISLLLLGNSKYSYNESEFLCYKGTVLFSGIPKVICSWILTRNKFIFMISTFYFICFMF